MKASLALLPRVALVIGVQDYVPTHSVHRGALDDVDAMAEMLKNKGGFQKVTASLALLSVTLTRILTCIWQSAVSLTSPAFIVV